MGMFRIVVVSPAGTDVNRIHIRPTVLQVSFGRPGQSTRSSAMALTVRGVRIRQDIPRAGVRAKWRGSGQKSARAGGRERAGTSANRRGEGQPRTTDRRAACGVHLISITDVLQNGAMATGSQRSARTHPLTSRLEGFGTTIFAEMSALATATGAINLGQGFPDTDGPPEVLQAAIDAINSGWNQYPPGPGHPVLRQAISRHQQRFTATPRPRS